MSSADLASTAPTDMIFVVGNSRSGTTMLARALGRHSAVIGLPELHYIEQQITGEMFRDPAPVPRPEAIRAVATILSRARLGYFTAPDTTRFADEACEVLRDWTGDLSYAALFHATLQHLAQLDGKRIACEQTPRNVFYIDAILENYPSARVVHLIRDPRDILLSQKNKWKRRKLGANIPRREALRSWMNYHPFTMSKLWTMAVGAGLNHKEDPRVLTLRFEDLLSDTNASLAAICDLAEINFDPDMAQVEQIGSSARTDATRSRGMDATRIAAWRKGGLSKGELRICERVAGPLMLQLHYDPEGQGGYLSSCMLYITLPFKLLGALMFNLNRVRNLGSWLAKRLNAGAET